MAVAALDSASIRQFLHSPVVPNQEKKRILQTGAAEFAPETLQALQALIDLNKFAELKNLQKSFQNLAQKVLPALPVVLESALPLAAEQQTKFQTALTKIWEREIELTNKVQPQILGGVKIRFGTEIIDLSLQTKLHNLSRALIVETPCKASLQ